MSTIYDFVTVLLFIAIVMLFLHYSRNRDQRLGPYLLPCVLCAVANQFGNMGEAVLAWLIIASTIGYVYLMLIRSAGAPDSPDI